MVDTSVLGVLGVGFLLGLRHATDADHIAAVSALVTRERSVVRSCLLGALWGAGHTAALLAAGVVTVVFKTAISPDVERILERAVAAMLVLLGGHVLWRAWGSTVLHRHVHRHGDEIHTHVHVHAGGDATHDHPHAWRLGGRPFAVGVMHGLAGSAALMLLALSTIPTPLGAVLYIVVFGLGATAGMLLLSMLMALPLVLAARHSNRLASLFSALAGGASLVLGLSLLVFR
jgi:ABC-type nickel/cobalt efflux system permease component RcnA